MCQSRWPDVTTYADDDHRVKGPSPAHEYASLKYMTPPPPIFNLRNETACVKRPLSLFIRALSHKTQHVLVCFKASESMTRPTLWQNELSPHGCSSTRNSRSSLTPHKVIYYEIVYMHMLVSVGVCTIYGVR